MCSGGGAPREARRGGLIGGVARPAEPFPGGFGGRAPPEEGRGGVRGRPPGPPEGDGRANLTNLKLPYLKDMLLVHILCDFEARFLLAQTHLLFIRKIEVG